MLHIGFRVAGTLVTRELKKTEAHAPARGLELSDSLHVPTGVSLLEMREASFQ